jgi:hypothetical protein
MTNERQRRELAISWSARGGAPTARGLATLAAKVTQTIAERAGALAQGDSRPTPESCRLRPLRRGSVTFDDDEDDVKMTKTTKTTNIVGADGMFFHVPPP